MNEQHKRPRRRPGEKEPCKGVDCTRDAYTRDYCQTHYLQFKRKGYTWRIKSRTAQQGFVCEKPGCDQNRKSKGLCPTHYAQWLRRGGHVDTTIPECTVVGCPEPISSGYLMCAGHTRISRRYKLTSIQLSQLYSKGCFICGGQQRLVIDHDHQCCAGGHTRNTCGGCVRGVLCDPHNRGLGLLGDSLGSLTRALEYLKGSVVN